MKVLVIDDEIPILEMISKILTRNGYEVVAVSNLTDASKELQKNGWDLIITDVMIPYKGGFELVDDIKSRSQIPVIIITGMSDDVLKATVHKADMLFQKPFNGIDLLEGVKKLTQERAF